MLDPLQGFVVFLLVTVALLGATVTTGLKAKLRAHLPLVALTVASLGTAIYYAEQLGTLYDLDAAGAIKDVHLALAYTATLSYLAPLASGIATLRNRRHRKLHLKLALATVALTVLAAVTGTWMVLAAERLAT
jgi:hypothetical protein